MAALVQDPILSAFGAVLHRAPEAPLLLAQGRAVTVGEVDALAHQVGELLAARPGGFAPHEVVALAACNGPGLPAALLALWRCGLPALLLDAHAPEAEARRIARSLGAATVLSCHGSWPESAAGFALSPSRDEWGEAAPRCLPGVAVVKLTSGSTGAPRGIATPAAALVADDAALRCAMGLRQGDRLLAAIPMSHSYGLSSLLLPALLRGTPLVLPEEGCLLAPFTAAQALGATVFPTVPAYIEALLNLSQPPVWPPSLRLVIAAGAPLQPETARRFRETFGLPIHVFYGASECGGICYDREGDAGERGTVGTPVPGVEIELLPCGGARGVARGGKVAVRSPAVAAGYLPDADGRLTDGRFETSDFACWAEGELSLGGRLDDLINVKGKKVDPREVETVLARLPGVSEVAVLGVPLPARGAEQVRAVIACRPGELSSEQVLGWCRGHLAPHKVPRSVILVPAIPRTARGKIDRPALLTLAGGARPAAEG
ncbi:MAG TPA: class I adenylate-forming enzyme family protein [Thermoanaerobaculia bacterium]|nr:class I adenylate-forming enzyme family protein [Thermoanaerobaculia bacterium]